VAPTFSIITACKGRLSHLKESLPAMLAQPDCEVIVVDYSCPDGTAAHVEGHFPKAKVVRVEGEEEFSNWKARNSGAALAKGAFLVFCDADIILAGDATKQLKKLVTGSSFGFFKRELSMAKGRGGLDSNQLRGFQVVPRASFRQLGGYDELMSGYASGADTDLEDRLLFLQLKAVPLDASLLDRIIHHDDEDRLRFHRRPVAMAYLVGHIYRRLKLAAMGIRKFADLQPPLKEQLHGLAVQAARAFLRQRKATTVTVEVLEDTLAPLKTTGQGAPRLRLSILIEFDSKDEPAGGR
jgi:glycosyltransferase involved in cell wall biosynthesis